MKTEKDPIKGLDFAMMGVLLPMLWLIFANLMMLMGSGDNQMSPVYDHLLRYTCDFINFPMVYIANWDGTAPGSIAVLNVEFLMNGFFFVVMGLVLKFVVFDSIRKLKTNPR